MWSCPQPLPLLLMRLLIFVLFILLNALFLFPLFLIFCIITTAINLMVLVLI